MHYYDQWAQETAAGDWLSRRIGVPMHRWHRDVAQTYRTDHSLPPPGPTGSPEEERRDAILWASWMHLPQFYQDPLYPYFLASIYRISGHSIRFVFLFQLSAGVLTVLLIWSITRRAFGDLVAVVAAAMALLCAPLMFYELLLLRDSLLVCVALALTWMLFLQAGRDRWWANGLLGVATGCACLLKSTFVLFGIGVVVGMIGERRRWRHVAVFVAAVLIGLSPLVARNVAVGTTPFALASSGPLTLLSSNDANYPPDTGFGIQVPLLAQFLGDTPGKWADAFRIVVASHSIKSYLLQLWDKWTRVWHWYEMPNNENLYYARRFVPILIWLPMTFWTIAPLGLVGIALSVGGFRERWPLFLLVITSVMPLLMFYVLGRFRVVLIAATIPFAAFTIVEVCRGFVRGRKTAPMLITFSVLGVGAWTGQGLGPHETLIRMSDWILPFSTMYEGRIEAAARTRQWATAAHMYREYFDRYEPTSAEIVSAGDSTLARELASMHRECADLFAAAGDPQSANAQRAAADRLAPIPNAR